MIIRKLGDKKPNVILFQGSPRDKDTCPNMDSKTHTIVEYMVENWSPFINFTVIDLSVNQYKKPIIQPCKGCVSTAGGYHCHFPCISPNQRVHTVDGFKEIKDIKIGDILQDGNTVINHLMTSESEMVYELKLTDGRRLELTSNHKVKVLSKERYRDINTNWKYYRKESWIELKDIKIGDYIPYIETDEVFISDENEDDYLYLIYGLIWGDGTFCNNTPLLYVDKKEVEFVSEIKNKLKDQILSILDHKISNQKISEDYNYYNTEMLKINFGAKLGKKMKLIFEKTNAKTRRLDINNFKTKRQIFNFINGWISTDGSINKTGGINLYNTSYECLRDVQLLLSRVGIKSNISDISHIKTNVRGKTTQRCSSLSISDQESVKILVDNINLLNIKKREKLSEYFTTKRRKLSHGFSKVKSIKSLGYKPVYDIEVENSHEFNCEGIKVHNCSCYNKGGKIPDLLHELDVYNLLQKCDAFIIISPIHWHSLTAQIKTMFDRLVCTNLTMNVWDAINVLGRENIKNSEVTGKLSKSGKYDNLLRNHLQGKVAGFYVHGDDGADDYHDRELPDSYNDVFDDGFSNNPKATVMPFVMQLKYSGVYVPDELVQAFYVNKGVDYYTANISVMKNRELFERADTLLDNLLNYLSLSNKE